MSLNNWAEKHNPSSEGNVFSRIGNVLGKVPDLVRGALGLDIIMLPVPSDKYTPSQEFIKNFHVRHSISRWVMIQADHDKLLEWLKDYSFNKRD